MGSASQHSSSPDKKAYNVGIETTTMTYEERRRQDYDDSGGRQDYEGRLQDSFFKYVKRKTDYDLNEVPWEVEGMGKPVQVQMSAYLRKV